MSEEEMAERIFQLEKELNEKNNEINILESRLKHLLKSRYIAYYDVKDSKTGQYIRNIEEVDKIASHCVILRGEKNKIFEYEAMKNIEDKLIIGYDWSDDKDHTCLMVLRKNRNGYLLLNNYYDEEVNELYKKITERSENKNGISIAD